MSHDALEIILRCILFDAPETQSLGSVRLKINTFILQRRIKLNKLTVMPFIMLQIISISNKCCSFEPFCFHKNI